MKKSDGSLVRTVELVDQALDRLDAARDDPLEYRAVCAAEAQALATLALVNELHHVRLQQS